MATQPTTAKPNPFFSVIAVGVLTNIRRDQNRASGTLIIRSEGRPSEEDQNPEPRVSKVRVTERLGSKTELYLPALEGHLVQVQALDIYANPIPPARGSTPSANGTIGAGLELPVLLIKDICVPADPEAAYGLLRITFMGNVGQKPEWSEEYKVSNFSVAVNRADAQDTVYDSWYRVAAWGRTGETVRDWVDKGKRVLVESDFAFASGFIRQDGSLGASVNVWAKTVKFLSPRKEGEAAAEMQQAHSATESEEAPGAQIPF